ncbi:MAG TPA: hypothetical protein VD789_13355 [Thermomicrobiales bacterium]|nr:hypothetical protein [Thermomicrobiales bacterium]
MLMTGRRHLVAANRSIRAAGLDEQGVDASLCEFLRDAARQIDAKGMDGVSARLVSAFLSAQKDVARAAARKPVSKPAEAAPVQAPASPAPLRAVEKTPLQKLRDKQRSRSA